MPYFNSTKIYGDLRVTGQTNLENLSLKDLLASNIAAANINLTGTITIPSGNIVGLNSGNITTALGFTPYDSTNPAEYITAAAIPTALKNPFALTIGGGLDGTSYDGSAEITISHADTSSQASLTALTGANVVSDVDLDEYGHVTSMATRILTLEDLGYTAPAGTNLSWTAGTTAGPTVNSSTGTGAAIPSASATASGAITTGSQEIAGEKTFKTNLNVGSGTANTGFIKLRVDQAGSPQITMTDNFGDMTWAMGGDDGDNSFKIHGTANATETMINNLSNPFFEISPSGNTITRSGTLYAEVGIGRLPANWDAAVTDVAGNDLILQSGLGTGTGSGSKIHLRTSDPTTTGTATQSLTTRVTVDRINTTVTNNLVVNGDLTVQGDTITMNTGTIFVEDKNIELGKVTSPTDATADGGGITLKGSTDKTITWLNADDAWHYNQHIILDGTNLTFGTANQRNALDLNNNKIIGIDSLAFSDSGPDGYIQIGSWSIWNSPNDLTTNSDGNFQFVTGGVRKASINTSGQLELPVATGTSPMLITSTTRVANLNVATSGTADKVANVLTIKSDGGTVEGTSLYTFDGSGTKSIDFISGTNVTLTEAAGTITFSSPSLSLGTTTGTGNAVTDITVSGHQITMAKGSTFLTTNSNDFGVFTINGTDSGYTWGTVNTNTNQTAESVGDTLTFVKGAGLNLFTNTVAGTDAIKIEHADTSTQASVDNSNGNVIQDITLDDFGHITALGSVDLDSRYITRISTTSALDVNAANGTQLFTGSTGSWTNRGPSNNNAGAMLSLNTHSGNYYSQLWFDTGGGNFYHRAANNALPTGAWRKVWDDGNDGSGSGLDADKFDGVESSQFLRSDETDTMTGDLIINGTLYATAKSFLIKHPTKENMKLRYGSLEGPENGVYIRGRLNSSNIIELPDYWTGLVREESITVSLTPVNSFQKLYIKQIKNNKIYVANENMLLHKDVDCYYTIFGERKDIEDLKVEIEQIN